MRPITGIAVSGGSSAPVALDSLKVQTHQGREERTVNKSTVLQPAHARNAWPQIGQLNGPPGRAPRTTGP